MLQITKQFYLNDKIHRLIFISNFNFKFCFIKDLYSPSHYHFHDIYDREKFLKHEKTTPFHARTLKLFPIFSIHPVS